MGGSEKLSRGYRDGTRTATSRKIAIGATGAFTALLTVIQIAAAPAHEPGVRHPLAQGSVWDSVFTLAQAARGEPTFRATCANCHGDSLAGINDAPALKGPDFIKNWDGNTLAKLFNRINNDMPSDNPGTLSKQQVADLVAFILRANAYPAGSKEVFAAPESLSGIKFGPKP